MTGFRIIGLIALILELLLAIPVLGGTIVIGTAYIILGVTLILHIVALVVAANTGAVKYPGIIGIITSVLAWIPFLGWVLHVVTFILYLIAVIKPERN
jgi:hypothetical protein